MTLHVNAFVSIMLLSAATTAHAQSPNRTLAVYVTAAAADPGDDADPQRKATLDDARNALKALERSVKAAHGGTRERWPAEVEERYRIAEESALLAGVRYLYGHASQEELAGSVEDVRRAFAGVGLRGRRQHVVLVDSASDAQLIVEIKSRRSVRIGPGLFGRQYFALFVVKPGPKLATEQFAAIPRTYRQDALLVRPPQSGAPEWLWEAAGQGSWKLAGAVASSLVDQFIDAQYDRLTTSAITR